MTESPFILAECTVDFEVEAHYDYPKRLRILNAVAGHPTFGELGTMRCLIVGRRDLFKSRGDFLEVMDDASHELMEFSAALFDAHSIVLPWLDDGGRRGGSGCWGVELSVGEMVYLEDLTVVEPFRGRGVGSWMLQQLFRSSFVLTPQGSTNVFCWPMPPRNETDARNWDAKVGRVNKFFRKNGFRRIGRTSFFGYSPSPGHPSRQLPMENDPEREDSASGIASHATTPQQLRREYPLHLAIINNKTPEIARILTTAYATNPAIIYQRDGTGQTPLYVAASVSNLPALRTLIDLGRADNSRNAADNEHMTVPLDRLQGTMRQTREFLETMMGTWNGYSPETLACEYLLKKALGQPLIAESEEEYITKRRFGCTCGLCTDQWLSPRMRFRLQTESEMTAGGMGMDVVYFKAGKPLSAEKIPFTSAQYLPLALRTQMHKAFYQGYRILFIVVFCLLKDASNGLPTTAHLLAKGIEGDPQNVNFYINKGGRVDYALNAIIHAAEEQSVLGDGEMWDNPDEVRDGGMVNMPKCANDLAFSLVRKMLGLDPAITRGPYNDGGEDVDMYDDDEEDF